MPFLRFAATRRLCGLRLASSIPIQKIFLTEAVTFFIKPFPCTITVGASDIAW